MKKKLSIVPLLIIIAASYFLYTRSIVSSSYEGLPTVPCIDTTRSIVQDYSMNVKIKINGKNYPLDPKIGHDFGQCLHDVYVNDSSGKVFIKTNDTNTYTLGEFFDVWRKTFNNNQIFNNLTGPTKAMEVFINGVIYQGSNLRDVPLFPPNGTIEVDYN